MSPLDQFILDVKRKKTPLHASVYSLGQRVMRTEIPAPRAVFEPMRRAYEAQLAVSDFTRRVFFHQPMFRAACESCGPDLLLYGGFPYLYGDLRLRIGAGCKIHGRTSLVAGKVFDAPTLELGDHTSIGFGVVISVSKRVTLGRDVRLADGVFITDNPGHPLDAARRRNHEPVDPESVKPVFIEDDVWLGTRTIVLPGVRIGAGTVVGAGSVVSRDLPAGVLAVGSPARPVRSLLQPLERDAERVKAMAYSETQ